MSIFTHLPLQGLPRHQNINGGVFSLINKGIAEERGLRPLNRFESWLLRPAIDNVKGLYQEAFRQACIETLGEDPNDW